MTYRPILDRVIHGCPPYPPQNSPETRQRRSRSNFCPRLVVERIRARIPSGPPLSFTSSFFTTDARAHLRNKICLKTYTQDLRIVGSRLGSALPSSRACRRKSQAQHLLILPLTTSLVLVDLVPTVSLVSNKVESDASSRGALANNA